MLQEQTWRAFAKLNLELRVRGKRPDGYHEIRTVLQTIDLHDEIHVLPAENFAFNTNRGPADDSNLVVRAVRAFERETSIDVRLKLILVKNIPTGAGLGGGSSDAATTLLGLNRGLRANIPGERLHRMLSDLGSDVPFFAVGGCAVAIGRGETLFPLPDEKDSWFVIVNPGLSIPTGEAYSWLTELDEFTTILSFCARFMSREGCTEPTVDARFNDFETPLFRRFPELAEIKGKLSASGARFASLTGSGATLFGQFSAESEARKAAETLGQELDVKLARPLRRSDYFRRMIG